MRYLEHLVYCDKKAKVLENLIKGKKTMIVRGAAARKLPYGRVFPKEKLYFVENDGSKLIKAEGFVKDVINSEVLTSEESIAMLDKFKLELNLSKEQLKRWSGKKRLCLISVENVRVLDNPVQYEREKNMDDWIIVESINDILTCSEKEYKNIRYNDPSKK